MTDWDDDITDGDEINEGPDENDADLLEAGDEACWTADGILVRWGRLVFDIFGRGPSSIASPKQAAYLLAFFEKQMPADLPDDPR